MYKLENVAEAYTLHAQSKHAPPFTEINTCSGMQTLARHGAAAHAEKHHEHGDASMPEQGRGTDRNRGGGRWSGSQESRMAGPKNLSSGHQSTVLLKFKQSLHLAVEVTRALYIFRCCSGPGAVAAQHNLRLRPYNAEPHVYGFVEAAF